MVPTHHTWPACIRHEPTAVPNQSALRTSDIDNALAQTFDGVSDGLTDLRADGIADTLKLIFGRRYDADHVPLKFVDYLASQQLPVALIRDRLNLDHLRILTAFYAGLWQYNAFQENGDFDFDGLVAFVSHYLGESNDWTTNCLGSEVGQRHFEAIKRFGFAEDANDPARVPSICDSVGGEIALPKPMPALFVSGGRYHGLYLANISLMGITLNDVHFSDSNFSGARLSLIVFDKVSLHKCCLDEAIFDKAVLTAVHINKTNAQRANFSQSKINGGQWSASYFNHTGFHRTEIEGLTSEGCSFKGARFNGPRRAARRVGPILMRDLTFLHSNLDAAAFCSVVASGVNLDTSKCHGITFVDTVFTGLRLTGIADGALFERNQFQSSTFNGMVAKGSRWQDIDFDEHCTFAHANLADSRMDRVTFQSSAFDGINFCRARLRNMQFARKDQPAMFAQAVFDGASVDRVIFRQCTFARAQFLATRFTGSQFDDCDLQSAQLRGASGLDVISAPAGNNLMRVWFAGVRGGLAEWALDGLVTPDGRDRMLNRVRYPECMTARLMRVANLPIRVDWILAIADFLERRAPGAMDADASLLSVMLALADHPDAAALTSSPLLERHIRTLLLRQMPGLNATGLSPSHAAVWKLQAAARIGTLLIGMADVAQWQRMSPLIASIFALHDRGMISLNEETLVGLRHAREAIVPAGLADAVQAVIGGSLFAPVHPLLLTPDASRAIVVTPGSICDLLDITHNPVTSYVSYFNFRNTPNGWACVGTHGESISETMTLFPVLARGLTTKATMLSNLIHTLGLPLDLTQIFANGLIGREKYDLTQAPQQQALIDTFDLLTQPDGVVNAVETAFTSAAQRRAAALRPVAAHQAAMWNALSPLRQAGAIYPDAALCLGLASLFYHAASPAMFGSRQKSPGGMCAYALAWANLGFDRYPVLRYRLPSQMPYHALVNRTIGHVTSPGVTTSNAADLGSALHAVLRLPLWGREPNIAAIRATLSE